MICTCQECTNRLKQKNEPLDSRHPSQVTSSNKDVGPSVQIRLKSHLQPSPFKNGAVKSASEEIQLNARGAKEEFISVKVSNCTGLASRNSKGITALVSGMSAYFS